MYEHTDLLHHERVKYTKKLTVCLSVCGRAAGPIGLSNQNVYIGDVFGSQFYISDVIGIELYFCDVCGLPKQMSEIFEALIVSDVNEAAISVIMILSNCNYT